MFSKNVGPVQLEHAGVNLGLLMGGLELDLEEDVFRTKADVTGDQSRSIVVLNTKCNGAGAITEATLEQIQKFTGGTVSGTSTKQLLVSTRVGEDLRDNVGELIIKPLEGGVVSTTEADWIKVAAAVLFVTAKPTLTYNQQRMWGFAFEGLPVIASDIASGGHLYNSGSPEWAVGNIYQLGKAAA